MVDDVTLRVVALIHAEVVRGVGLEGGCGWSGCEIFHGFVGAAQQVGVGGEEGLLAQLLDARRVSRLMVFFSV